MKELARLPADATELERAADPAAYVLQACERAKVWLAHVLEHGDIEQIVELKSQAEAIRVYTMSKQLGKDAELSAAEIVRRAERGIGLAIRKGQQTGEIRRRGERGPAKKDGADNTSFSKPGPADFAPDAELRSNGAGIYHLTDDVSDEQFDRAVATARTEGNLSRANVVRHVQAQRPGEETAMPQATVDAVTVAFDRSAKGAEIRRARIREMAEAGHSSTQIGAAIGILPETVRSIAREHGIRMPAEEVLARTRRHDSNRIVRETVHALEGLAMGLELVEYTDLDPSEIEHWADSLTTSVRAINRLIKQIKKMKEQTQ